MQARRLPYGTYGLVATNTVTFTLYTTSRYTAEERSYADYLLQQQRLHPHSLLPGIPSGKSSFLSRLFPEGIPENGFSVSEDSITQPAPDHHESGLNISADTPNPPTASLPSEERATTDISDTTTKSPRPYPAQVLALPPDRPSPSADGKSTFPTFWDRFFALLQWGTDLVQRRQWWERNFTASWNDCLWPDSDWHTLVLCGFLHSTLSHFVFNVFTLFFFGRALEQYLGAAKFLALFATTSVLSSICQVCVTGVWEREPFTRCLGASGGVYGVMAFTAALFPTQVVYVYALLPIPLWACVGILCFAELAIPVFFEDVEKWISDSISDVDTERSVAHGAHMSGLFLGGLLGIMWRRRGGKL